MAMGSTFEDRSDLFPPPYIPGDPESDRANREWQARNRNMTYDLVDELRMPRMPAAPRTAANATEGLNTQSFGTDPWLQAGAAMVGLPDRNSPAGKVTENYAGGDPRGDVDPLALVALAQGGPYDIDARRAAIQARRDAIAKLLTDQQVAQQLAQAAPTDTASRELTSGLRPDYKDTGQGIQAGDMAVSGATPGSVTQQGFFSTAVPNEPDPNNVFSAPPPPNSTPYTQPDEDESEPDTGKGKTSDFDEDAANQAVADALAEAMAAAPAAPADPADPGSQHSSGKAADVVSPSATNAPASFNSGYSDFIGGPGGFAGFNAGSTMPGFGIPGDAGIPGSGNVLGPGRSGSGRSAADNDAANQAIADMLAEAISQASPNTNLPEMVVEAPASTPSFTAPALSDLDVVAPGMPSGTYDPGSHSLADMAMGKGGPDKGGFSQGIVDPNAPSEGGIPGYSPGNFAAPAVTPSSPVATPADNPDTFVGPIDPDPAATFAANNAVTVSPFGRSKDDSSPVSMDKQAADKAALSQSTHAMTPSGGRNAVATALSEQGRGRAGIADFAPDISLSDMASLASMGLPAAPGVPASDFADFATGKSMDAAVAAASMNAPGESGPVGPGGLGGLGSLGGPSVGGFSATGGFGTSPGGPGMGMSEGAMAAAAAAAAAANGDISLGDFSGGDYGGITDAASPGGYDTQGTTDLGDLGGGTGGITDAASPGSPGGGDFTGPGAAGGGGFGDQGPSPGGGAGPGVGMSEGAAAAAADAAGQAADAAAAAADAAGAAADAAAGAGDVGGFGGEGSGASGPGGDTAW